MQSQNQAESIGDFIHKESNQRKLKAKGLSPIGLKDNSTIGENSTQIVIPQESIGTEVKVPYDNSQMDNKRTRNQLKNFEIDEYLYQLIAENMIDEKFLPFYAKACHILSIATVNRIKVNALNGRDKQKLFAYKIKGAMQVHYKLQYLKDNRE